MGICWGALEDEEVLEMIEPEDNGEWWHDLQEGKGDPSAIPAETLARKGVMTPLEATEELMNTFRPIRESIAELKRLLEAKADPNAPIPHGRGSPLRHVMTFAPSDKVEEMRDLLLRYGASESEDDKERWQIRKDAMQNEWHYTKAFYEDDRHLSPVGAAVDRA